MKIEWYIRILHDCNSADPDKVTLDVIQSMYKHTGMDKYPHNNYLYILTPPEFNEGGLQMVQLFWVHEKLRGNGIGKKLLQKINVPHGMIVDVRSKAMHHLCQSLGYSVSDEYIMDGEVIKLSDGDKYYYKEKVDV